MDSEPPHSNSRSKYVTPTSNNLSDSPSLLQSLCPAQERRFGSWEVGLIVGNEGVYAATINDSKAIFGQYCFFENGKCLWLLANDIDCQTGSEYAVLVNSDAGASSLKLMCVKIEGKARYAFAEFNEIDQAIRVVSKFGIAFPLQSGLFQVNRFSVDGATQAISFMQKAIQSVMVKQGRF